MMLLTSQLQEEQQKITEYIANEDEDGEAECKKKIKALRKRIDELKFSSSIVEISGVETSILSQEMIVSISSNNADSILELLDGIISEWITAIQKILQLIDNELFKQTSYRYFCHHKETDACRK